MQELELTRPDDWHLHLRDGAPMRDVVAHTATQFGRAIVMPNLRPPVASVESARAYRSRIMSAFEGSRKPGAPSFEPLMTLYLQPDTTPARVKEVAEDPQVHAFKLYPAGATTNSDAGVRGLEELSPVFEAMQEHDVPLLIHGESTDPECDVFDREARFVEESLAPLVERFSGLRVVLEHITTADAAAFVKEARPSVGATITCHHLLLNRNAIFQGGLQPHHYCLPVLKRERHRQALVAAATGGSPKFFLGTDSAPHPVGAKESACACAGCYTAHAAIELYAEAFEDAGALDRLEGFASFHGPDFYGLPRNQDRIRLRKESWEVPARYQFGDSEVVPLRAGESCRWRLVHD